jgi:[acyl-carrier-protein] S-malonyltransferase
MLDILAGDDAAQRVLTEAGAALGEDLRRMARGPAEIFRNRTAQPLLCATQVATWSALRDHLAAPRAFAGYSLGELAAYGCVDALTTAQLTVLACQRAELMDAASQRAGGLLAVRGLSRSDIESLCCQSAAEIAIINGPDRFVIGVTVDRMDGVMKSASGLGAVVTRLPIGVAAHTSVLAAASENFRAALQRSEMRDPAGPVLAGVTGMAVHSRDTAIDALSRQISTTIDWAACLQTLPELGCTVLMELGPGNALARLARESLPDLPARSVADFRSLPAVVDWVHEQLARRP